VCTLLGEKTRTVDLGKNGTRDITNMRARAASARAQGARETSGAKIKN
jgi:hypothetical protein